MKKLLTMITAAAAAITLTVSVSAAEVKNGIYNIDVESDSTMFKIVNCDLTAADGKLTAAVTLSGTGYSKLFVGTGEQAMAADESKMITYIENAEGKYVYTFDIPALDEPIAVAAFSTKKEEWYDRNLTFKSDKIAAEPTTSEPTSSEPASGTTTGNTPADTNPDTGAAAVAAALPVAAVAVVFARKKR